MKMASIGFSWMETNTIEKKKIFSYIILLSGKANMLRYGTRVGAVPIQLLQVPCRHRRNSMIPVSAVFL